MTTLFNTVIRPQIKSQTNMAIATIFISIFAITTLASATAYGADAAKAKGKASADAKIDAPQAVTPDQFAKLIGPVGTPTAQMVFVDVSQGDAILLHTAENKNVLIDTATSGKAGMIITEALSLGAAKLDLLVITHGHSDHVAGFKKVAERLPITNYMDPAFAHPSGTYQGVLEFVQTNNIRYIKAQRGRKINVGNHASLEVLLPGQSHISGTRSDVNANSTITRVDMGDVCVLMLGDAEAETEEALVANGDRISCPVLKIAHHGGEFSTTRALLQAVKPVVAVISVGENNRYDHPSDLTLERLKEFGVTVLRTDLDGSIKLRTDGKKFSISSSKRPEVALPAQPAMNGSGGSVGGGASAK